MDQAYFCPKTKSFCIRNKKETANDRVLVAKGFPKTKEKIEKLGYNTIEIDVSEFRKLDGGLSCLSLRF